MIKVSKPPIQDLFHKLPTCKGVGVGNVRVPMTMFGQTYFYHPSALSGK